MQVLDLTGPFLDLVLKQDDRNRYEALYPSLFNHYFRYWCPKTTPYSTLPEAEIRLRALRVSLVCRQLAMELAIWGLDTERLQVVLFVGGNTSNGHAFRDGDQMVVWIPVESYATEMLARVFVAHELIHGLHYLLSPGFYFSDEKSRLDFGRQLMTEGVATYLTAEVLSVSDRTALWGDYLPPADGERWMNECRERLPELRELCRRHLSESSTNMEFFMANKPDDILKYRAGYFAGLELVRGIVIKYHLSATDLLTLDREKFEEAVLALLSI
jgi:hypothetical protein